MAQIYRTGRGSVKVRARWRHLPKENIIEIYEIPYSTTVEAVIDKVAELVKAASCARWPICATRLTSAV